MARPSAEGMASTWDRAALRAVAGQGAGRPGAISSESAVIALSISALCAPAGPADMLRSSSHRVPSRILRTGSRRSSRSASQETGQPT